MPPGIYIRSKEHNQNISNALKGKKRPPFSKEWIEKLSNANKGIRHSKEHRRKLSEGRKGKPCPYVQGEKNHFWHGGTSFEPYGLDWTKTLRRSIRERDHCAEVLCRHCDEAIRAN